MAQQQGSSPGVGTPPDAGAESCSRSGVRPGPGHQQRDVDTALARYRNGVPVTTIAEELGVTFDWVAQRVIAEDVRRDIPSRPPRRGRRGRPSQLDDPSWLRQELASAGVGGISRALSVRPSIVRAALRRHGISAAGDVRRDERSDPAARFHAGTSRVVRARRDLARALALQTSAVVELHDAGLTVAAIADRVEVDPVVIEDLLDPPVDGIRPPSTADGRTVGACPWCGQPRSLP